MCRIWLQIFLIFCVTSVSQSTPTGSPSQLACRSLLERSTTCQITYTGWQELTECLRGVSVHVPDIEKAITCTCVPQPPPIIEQGTEYDLPTPLPPTSVGPPALPEMEDDFPDHGEERDSYGGAPSSDLPTSPSGAGANLNNRPITGPQWMKARGTNLADFDYVAPDGSVAMASRARPPGVAGPAAVVLAVLVAVLLGVVIVLGCSRRRAEVDPSLEGEYEEGEGGGEEEEEGQEGAGEENLTGNEEAGKGGVERNEKAAEKGVKSYEGAGENVGKEDVLAEEQNKKKDDITKKDDDKINEQDKNSDTPNNPAHITGHVKDEKLGKMPEESKEVRTNEGEEDEEISQAPGVYY